MSANSHSLATKCLWHLADDCSGNSYDDQDDYEKLADGNGKSAGTHFSSLAVCGLRLYGRLIVSKKGRYKHATIGPELHVHAHKPRSDGRYMPVWV